MLLTLFRPCPWRVNGFVIRRNPGMWDSLAAMHDEPLIGDWLSDMIVYDDVYVVLPMAL